LSNSILYLPYLSSTSKILSQNDWSSEKQMIVIPTRKKSEQYSVKLRIVIKIAQLVIKFCSKNSHRIFKHLRFQMCLATVIACVCAPMAPQSFASFVRRTKSDGQYYVLVVSCVCMIVTFLLLLTVLLSRTSQGWRNAVIFNFLILIQKSKL